MKRPDSQKSGGGGQARAPTLYFIIAVKIAKGVLLLLLAFGVYRLHDRNLPEAFRRLLEFLHLDPERQFFHELMLRVGQITPAKMDRIALGTLVYSFLMLLEGCGMMFRIRWAGWLTIVESAFFIPIEIYELIHKLSHPEHPREPTILLVVLGLNTLIVWYLFQNRRRCSAAALKPSMTIAEAIKLLDKFRSGTVSRDKVLAAFQAAPVADLGFAQVDIHRALRKGFPEVIFGAGKTTEQVVKIAAQLLAHDGRVLVTRVSPEQARALRRRFQAAVHHVLARCVTIQRKPLPRRAGTIAVVCAGTSDLPVAEEAAVTAEIMGNPVERISDVGVAGVHRLFSRLETIRSANVVIVVAGMEGALPSVVAGLVSKPVIAVPTSIGYGASFGGLAPLLGMLNSCASGVTVVNIDNGFGAGYAASQINALTER